MVQSIGIIVVYSGNGHKILCLIGKQLVDQCINFTLGKLSGGLYSEVAIKTGSTVVR